MQLHNLKRPAGLKYKKIIGRGGKRGTTAGRGTKGQKARAGHRMRPELRDVIKKLPKLRGHRMFKLSSAPPSAVVNLDTLEKHFQVGDKISPAILADKKLIRRIGGRLPTVKILGRGVLTKKVEIINCQLSASAAAFLQKLGVGLPSNHE